MDAQLVDSMATQEVKRYFNPSEFADYFGISIAKVYQMVDKDEIPYFRMGRLIFFDMQKLHKHFSSITRGGQ